MTVIYFLSVLIVCVEVALCQREGLNIIGTTPSPQFKIIQGTGKTKNILGLLIKYFSHLCSLKHFITANNILL